MTNQEQSTHNTADSRPIPEHTGEGSSEAITQAVFEEIDKHLGTFFPDHPYHGPDHSLISVLGGATHVMDVGAESGLPDTDAEAKLAVKLAAYAHDAIINTTEPDPDRINAKTYGHVIRLRGAGEYMPKPVRTLLGPEGKGNEEQSWLHLEKIMDRYDPDRRVFTDRVRLLAHDMIFVTYPEAMSPVPYPDPKDTIITIINPETGQKEEFDLEPYLLKDGSGKPAGLKFWQPFLTEHSPLPVVAVALGDLSEGGRVGPTEFRILGNAEFWETCVTGRVRDIPDNFADWQGTDRWRRMVGMSEDMLGWAESQVGFLLWQKIRFHEVMDTNRAINAVPDQAHSFKERMLGTYKHFDENIFASAERVKHLRETYKSLKYQATYEKNPEDTEKLFFALVNEMDYERFRPGTKAEPATTA